MLGNRKFSKRKLDNRKLSNRNSPVGELAEPRRHKIRINIFL